MVAARPSGGICAPCPDTCPVALYAATTEAESVRFNLIKTNNRIKMQQTVDAGTGEQVSRGDLVKGFEITKGSMSCSTRTSLMQ